MNENDSDLRSAKGSLARPLVVLKLGGSLLECTDLADRLRSLVETLRGQRILIVVGGGDAADVVRDWSVRFALPEESAHWLAIRSLSVTRGLVKELLPECCEVDSQAAASAAWTASERPVLLKLEAYLREAERNHPDPLPHNWDVTSDSIAAWVAAEWGADQLIMLKSIDLPASIDLQQAASHGFVDPYLPTIATKLPRIGWCRLLSDGNRICDWQIRQQGVTS
ncbi:MAG: hypothetical protein U0941_26480 [Planctomycetaceae bacterium]